MKHNILVSTTPMHDGQRCYELPNNVLRIIKLLVNGKERKYILKGNEIVFARKPRKSRKERRILLRAVISNQDHEAERKE